MGTLFDDVSADATLFADGGSRGNPGPAASGAVLLDASSMAQGVTQPAKLLFGGLVASRGKAYCVPIRWLALLSR